jgi:hypothetical protein
MVPKLINVNNSVLKSDLNENGLSKDLEVNYHKSRFEKLNHVTTINIDRAVTGKGDVSHTKTYTQNLVKKFELTGNKEICVRKVFIAERADGLFDITVRELNVYYRKDKKHHFNKSFRFKSANGNIEFILEMLKSRGTQKNISNQTTYLLN